MDKGILKKGLIVVAASIILFLLLFFLIPAQSIFSANPGNATIAPHSSYYASVNLSDTGLVIFMYQSNSSVDAYLVNGSAFGSIRNYLNGSAGLLSAARGMEGEGALEIFRNATSGSFPYQQGENLSVPYYTIANYSPLTKGSYYAVFRNNGNAPARMLYEIGATTLSQFVWPSVGFFILVLVFIAGLVIIAYAFIKKPKAEQSEEAQKPAPVKKTPDEISRLYDKIEGRKARSRKRGKRA